MVPAPKLFADQHLEHERTVAALWDDRCEFVDVQRPVRGGTGASGENAGAQALGGGAPAEDVPKGAGAAVGDPGVPGSTPSIAATGARLHTIKPRDSLSRLSSTYYGSARHVQWILDANPGLDPLKLPLGKEIVIPAEPTTSGVSAVVPVSAPSVVPTPQPVAGPVPAAAQRHRVASGETLSAIAIRYYQDERLWVRIAEANPGIDPNRLRPSSEIVIPARGSNPAPVAGAAASLAPRTVPAGAVIHRIVERENLTTLSRRYYGSDHQWQRILDANPGIDANRLQVGMELVVPDVVRARTL